MAGVWLPCWAQGRRLELLRWTPLVPALHRVTQGNPFLDVPRWGLAVSSPAF